MSSLLRAFLILWVSMAQAQDPVQEVQQSAPHLAAFAGSPMNFQSVVQGLTQGRPVLLTTAFADGTAELASFTPAAPMSVGAVVNALEQARLQLGSVGLARPNASELATALAGGILATPGMQLGGVVPTHPASPGVRIELVHAAAPSASAGGSEPAASEAPMPPYAAPDAMVPGTPDSSIAISPLVTPSPAPITVLPPASPGQQFYAPPAIVPGAR
jgi:hypothetical protein